MFEEKVIGMDEMIKRFVVLLVNVFLCIIVFENVVFDVIDLLQWALRCLNDDFVVVFDNF